MPVGDTITVETSNERAVEIYHNAATWIIGYAAEVQRGVPESEIEGWILYEGYLRTLAIPMMDILRRIAREETEGLEVERELDFWRTSIRRCAFRCSGGKIVHTYPGEPIPLEAEAVHHVEFHAHPRRIPFADIMNALEHASAAASIPLREILLRFRGVWIRDGSTLMNLLLTRDVETKRVTAALDRWRDETSRRLAKATPPTRSQTSDCESVLPELQGRFLDRPRLASFLGRTSRTLDRWDRLGFVKTGVPWHKGNKVGSNLVLYDLARNWPAIRSLLPDVRDRDADRRLAHELGALAASVCTWSESVLDNLVEKEELAAR